MSIVARFAPSPTGELHIGAARTALFNLLFAQHHGGRFLLRIEDTDRARSTDAAVKAIIDGLRWLGIDWDGDVVFQSARAGRHADVARQLLADGRAYRCYCTPLELEQMRAEQRAAGKPVRYDGRWRDRDPDEAPGGVEPAIRLKAPRHGETVIADLVQGEIRVANEQLDDMILLRADGTPTYMLAVVVDDHDMGVTHVIRGSDHLTNTFRQYQLYEALRWTTPQFAHIPLIHGRDGAKLSKRHGALGVAAYRDQGFLPDALCNYLLRLGWSHGDDEIISREQAIAWFGLDAVGRAPARFDLDKMLSLNAHYLRRSDDAALADRVIAILPPMLVGPMSPQVRPRLCAGMPGLKERAKTLVELAENARFYAVDAPIPIGKSAVDLLTTEMQQACQDLLDVVLDIASWDASHLEAAVRGFAEQPERAGVSFRSLAQALRAALTGSTVSPPIFEVMAVLGQTETAARLRAVAAMAVTG